MAATDPEVPERLDHPEGDVPVGAGVPATREPGDVLERLRATREPQGAWLGGVCTGLAAHLGAPVLVLRIGFVALGCVQLIGLIAYAALWLALPPAPKAEVAPGLESASRSNLRTTTSGRRRAADVGTVLALGMMAAGLFALAQFSGLGVSQAFLWPVAFAFAGVALVWRTADTAGERREKVDGPAWLAPFVARGRVLTIARMVLGMALVGAAVSMVIASQAGVEELPRVLGMTGLALAGIGLVVAPWAYRSRQALQVAREDKVRADERADMAAHLHDSVLQTLALIQRQSTDAKAVATLARRQERELRTWLYGDVIKEETFKAALTAAAADVEDERDVPIEVVCVGDGPMDEKAEATVRAAREAMVNAAKHSGAPRISVYAEVDDDRIEVFVKDRGKGFDMADIADDRMGVKGSILGRMERHGGSARIRSAPADGTEVRLEMER
ncbi:ATP-binding protein [Mariniluteicoccus endophyticus]